MWNIGYVAADGNDDSAADGELLEQHVCTTVRHKLRRALDALLDLSDDDLRDLGVEMTRPCHHRHAPSGDPDQPGTRGAHPRDARNVRHGLDQQHAALGGSARTRP
ncbi:hypothetical protein [Cellulosimicrobium cellulans]|uniref:hypothetical protein n=1 Tax=Cellulosimicrobium cellulans TaxID=1710 RepID=UPI001BACBF70|nr:hypothetical protein [Cellulosimicrobium cellulans]QUC01240.1 hypothetical protein J5A69_08790 [Cellulosimicrobium cellulans]